MDYNHARTLLENLLDRMSTDSRLAELTTGREADALRLFLGSDVRESGKSLRSSKDCR